MFIVLSANNTHDQRRRDFIVKKVPLNSIEKNVLYDNKTDDMDEIFMQLLHMEPPVDMVMRIMQVVSHVPPPRPLSQWKDYDFFMTEYDKFL